jgi:hypothetical protein
MFDNRQNPYRLVILALGICIGQFRAIPEGARAKNSKKKRKTKKKKARDPSVVSNPLIACNSKLNYNSQVYFHWCKVTTIMAILSFLTNL